MFNSKIVDIFPLNLYDLYDNISKTEHQTKLHLQSKEEDD